VGQAVGRTGGAPPGLIGARIGHLRPAGAFVGSANSTPLIAIYQVINKEWGEFESLRPPGACKGPLLKRVPPQYCRPHIVPTNPKTQEQWNFDCGKIRVERL
jgi:hypothetical protein